MKTLSHCNIGWLWRRRYAFLLNIQPMLSLDEISGVRRYSVNTQDVLGTHSAYANDIWAVRADELGQRSNSDPKKKLRWIGKLHHQTAANRERLSHCSRAPCRIRNLLIISVVDWRRRPQELIYMLKLGSSIEFQITIKFAMKTTTFCTLWTDFYRSLNYQQQYLTINRLLVRNNGTCLCTNFCFERSITLHNKLLAAKSCLWLPSHNNSMLPNALQAITRAR